MADIAPPVVVPIIPLSPAPTLDVPVTVKSSSPSITWIILGIVLIIAIIVLIIFLIRRFTAKKGCGTGPACAGITPYCITGVCQQCRNTADCPTGGGSICTNGSCTTVTPCVTSTDCPPGQSCTTGVCVTTGLPCQSDLDCGLGGQVCRSNTCQFPTCSTNTDCPLPGQVCQGGVCEYGDSAVSLAEYIATLSSSPTLPPEISPEKLKVQAPMIAGNVLAGCTTGYRQCAAQVPILCSGSGLTSYCTSVCADGSTNDPYCFSNCAPTSAVGSDTVYGFPCNLIRKNPTAYTYVY